MQSPQFTDGQFVDGTLLNGAVAQLMANFELIGSELHTPGLLSPSSLVFTPTALVVAVQAPSPFAVLFGSGAGAGLVVSANGVVSGAISSTYQVNCASLVPASGPAVTVYIVASYGQIGQQQTQVIGPQDGHPDYDATFAPFQWYLEELDTLSIGATTTAPNNTTTFELCHFSLAQSQITINPSTIFSTWHYASAVLNPTGVAAGTYSGATVTVGLDGRVTAVSGAAYGLLAGANTWTQPNLFDQPVTVVDPNNGGLIVSGNASLGANIQMKGNGTTTPNKWIRVLNGAFQIISNAYAAALLTLDDLGNLTIGGSLTVTSGIIAGATIQGAALTATGGVTVGSSVSAGGNITAGGSVNALFANIGADGVVSTGPVSATGNITAASGRLLATFGASGGNGNTAPIMADFAISIGATSGYSDLPNGYIRQWGTLSGYTGTENVVAFPKPFPNGVQCITVTDNGPSCYPYGASPDGLGAFFWFSATAASHGCYWEAIGF